MSRRTKGAATAAPASPGQTVYTTVNPRVLPKKYAQSVGEAIEELAAKHGGRATAEDVVHAAKSRSSVLHRFIWRLSDEEAAYRHRLQLARTLMTTITVKVNEVQAPAFVHLDSAPGYISAKVAYTNVDAMAEFIRMAKNEAVSFYRKWKRVRQAAGLSEIFDVVERALAKELGIETELPAPASPKTGTDE